MGMTPISTPPILRPPIINPPPGSTSVGVLGIIGGAVILTDVIGRLGGYEFRNSQLAKLGKEFDPNTGLSRDPIFGGKFKPLIEVPPPFKGGGRKTSYIVSWDWDQYSTISGARYSGSRENGRYSTIAYGKIQYLRVAKFETDGINGLIGADGYPEIEGITQPRIRFPIYYSGSPNIRTEIYNIRVEVQDGQPDVDLPNSFKESNEDGSKGNKNADRRDREKGGTPPPISISPPPTSRITNNSTTNNSITNNSITNNSNTNNSNTNNSSSFVNNSFNSGGSTSFAPTIAPSPTTVPPTPVTTPTPSPTPKPQEQERKIAPAPTPTPSPDLSGQIAKLGAILGTIAANTEPKAQRANAKNGSCDAMNSPDCTKGVEDRIKEPLLDKVNQNAGLISGLGATLSGINSLITSSIIPKLAKIQEFAEGVAKAAKLDKVYNFLTFLTVIHNAQMLSNNLLQTLESTISQGLAVIGIKDGDSPIDINAVVNKSTSDLFKSILGESRYNELDAQFKSANKIYQSGANLVYQVRSLYDSSRATAELTGANVGQLMNALKKDGVVTESAYPNKCESPSQINSLMERLQNLESAASHLNSISSNAYGITETVKQIKDDKAAFDKLVEESPIKKGIENKAASKELLDKKLASPSAPLTTNDLVKPD